MKAPQDIILKPMITEQSVDNMQQSKYTFKVAKDANKIEIAQAAEALFHGFQARCGGRSFDSGHRPCRYRKLHR